MNFHSIEGVVTNCVVLTDLNLDFVKLCQKSITFLCQNIASKLQKISLWSVGVTDENLNDLITKCCQISELNLTNTLITNDSFKTITSSLFKTLTKLRYVSFIF